jgi:saccharopine dehydrogenase (NAD+, L-lysine-forming)
VKAGVHNVEEFNPDPFLEKLATSGLPWHVIENGDIEL